VIDPREWTIAVLISVVIGVAMAALSAPWWSYPIVLAAFIAGLLVYQRGRHAE
jgi:Kef-type K+ transport system membrane component KefB